MALVLHQNIWESVPKTVLLPVAETEFVRKMNNQTHVQQTVIRTLAEISSVKLMNTVDSAATAITTTFVEMIFVSSLKILLNVLLIVPPVFSVSSQCM